MDKYFLGDKELDRLMDIYSKNQIFGLKLKAEIERRIDILCAKNKEPKNKEDKS